MLLWIDLETTGLDPKEDLILEVAWLTTTDDLKPLTPLRSHVIRQTNTRAWELIAQSPFVYDMHNTSGLLDEIEADVDLVQLSDVEEAICHDIGGWADNSVVMVAGSSPHFDMSFIQEDMPILAEKLSHRIFDVTTLKTLFKGANYNPEIANDMPHRAASDIANSLEYAVLYHEILMDDSNMRGF